MPITSNSITHFTRNKEALKGILSDNFRLKYCHETIVSGSNTISIRVPLVSFCDIPLSQVKNHIGKYGDYGIGLTRAWAVKNKLNPVIYLEKKSNLAKNLLSSFAFFNKDATPENLEARRQFADAFRYMKNYEGELVRPTETFSDYRFAEEREWRYVPELSDDYKMLYTDTTWKRESKQAQESIGRFFLKFEPEDIRYIIIKSDAEISEFVRHLDDVKGGNFSKREVERLTTRIITSEQIRTDF